MAELGSHQMDAAGIFCSALRKDGRKPSHLVFTQLADVISLVRIVVEDHVYCTIEFPAGI